MKREVKFRGKRLDGNGWAVGHLVKMWGAWHIIDWNDEKTAYAIDPATVGQFTSLQDNECVDIFEGDIVKIDGDEVGEIIYTGAGFYYEGTGSTMLFILLEEVLYMAGVVIGNIHDNPELLKTEAE